MVFPDVFAPLIGLQNVLALPRLRLLRQVGREHGRVMQTNFTSFGSCERIGGQPRWPPARPSRSLKHKSLDIILNRCQNVLLGRDAFPESETWQSSVSEPFALRRGADAIRA